jgi:hypothetical protein
LPNGNTLVCESAKGRIFEVAPDREVVWEYHSPFMVKKAPYWGCAFTPSIFQAHRYGPGYEGLKGKNLDPDRYEWIIHEKSEETLEEEKVLSRLEKLGY